jgi:hypothetical protein
LISTIERSPAACTRNLYKAPKDVRPFGRIERWGPRFSSNFEAIHEFPFAQLGLARDTVRRKRRFEVISNSSMLKMIYLRHHTKI